MRYATRKGMNRPALMRFALKLLANLPSRAAETLGPRDQRHDPTHAQPR